MTKNIYIHYGSSSETLLVRRLRQNLVYKPEDADIIMFTGGADDIHPQYYNQKNIGSNARNFPQERTERELEIYHKYKDEKKFIGICRGHQLLNIVHGGTLLQHIENHNCYNHPIYNAVHMAIKLGEVNSLHHQCISETSGRGLAFSKEGLIEAIQFDNALGVQWHPEYAKATDFSFTYFEKLFKDFINGNSA